MFVKFLHGAKTELGFEKAKSFFKAIEDGRYRPSTSTFTKFEYRGFLKDMRATSGGHDAAKAELDALEDALDRLLEDFGVELISAEAALGEKGWIDDCIKIIDASSPTLSGSDWLVMKGADTVHAVIASRVGIGSLATFDNGFRGMKDSVSPQILWD